MPDVGANNTTNGEAQTAQQQRDEAMIRGAAAVNAVDDECKADVAVAAVEAVPDAAKADVAAAAFKAAPDAAKANLAAAALEAVPDAAKADIATAAVQAVPYGSKEDVADAAAAALTPDAREKLGHKLLPDQNATNKIWLWIVMTFALVLASATLALVGAVFVSFWRKVDAAMVQMLLTVFTTVAGILAGFVSGRASTGRAARA
jgi:hypothetical protein